MSKPQRVRAVAESAACPADLFRLLADGPSWVAWSPLEECVSEGLGADGKEHVGTVRMNRLARTRGWDRITEMDPDRALGYVHVRGLPVRDYAAAVTLTPKSDGGTTIVWIAEFEPRWPGTGGLLRRRIDTFLGQCARGLATFAGGDRPPVTDAPATSS